MPTIGTEDIIDLMGTHTGITKSGMAIMVAGIKNILNTDGITVEDMFTKRSTIITMTAITVGGLHGKM
ncbi:MAG: hypothetical protein PVG44_17205 [Desulfobacterales bacterium]